MPEKIGVMSDICCMLHFVRSHLFGRIIGKVFLTFILLIIVKGPETFSEEYQPGVALGNNLSPDGDKVTISIKGKSFSFILPNENNKYNPVKNPETVALLNKGFSLRINSKGNLTPEMLTSFITRNNPALDPAYANRLATIYIEEATDEGINWDVAFSQMCLETAYLKFGGDVLPGQHNFCGLGVTGGGVKGASFSDIRAGVRAHIQHLKAYASHSRLANPVIDRRFKYVKRGSAPDVHKLTGKWAVDKNYGEKINRILEKMYALVKDS